jgi:hypothetical protein
MGVWTVGPLARHQALSQLEQRLAYSRALRDWQEQDVGGSPYAIADYHVPAELGGEAGLARFRSRLNQEGLKLLLDFVPNHVGLDHRWVHERPEWFVQSSASRPETFVEETATGTRWLAHGKDPYFAAWADTAQLDYRQPGLRDAMTELLCSLADRCDGVRCDMAMLVLQDVFARTWQSFPKGGAEPESEFWEQAIRAVRAERPEFLFLAEGYWGLEPRLQAIGFDYVYDKEVYDRLVRRESAGVQQHLLGASRDLVGASAHFLENHDEARIASTLSLDEHRVAALLVLALPGMRLLHDGQLTGACVKTPVALRRRQQEPTQPRIQELYRGLLTALTDTAVGHGTAKLLEPKAAWPENPTSQNFVLVQWQNSAREFDLVVINLSPHRSQCYTPLKIDFLEDHDWEMADRLGSERFVRSGPQLRTQGLFLDVPASAAQLFHFNLTD